MLSRNLLRLRAIFANGPTYSHHRNLYTSAVLEFPRGVRSPAKSVPADSQEEVDAATIRYKNANQEKEEISAITEIESYLFEQSDHKHKVVKPWKGPGTKHRKENDSEPIVKIKQKKKLPYVSESIEIYDTELNLSFLKLDNKDPRLNQLFLMARSRKQRTKQKQILIEGHRQISEALHANLNLQTLLFSKKDQLAIIKDDLHKKPNILRSAQIFKIPHHDLSLWSVLSTCPGLLGIFDHPDEKFAKNLRRHSTYPITVICDEVREPNNIGSIIRSCAALPVSEIIVMKGSCDPWDTKSIRGGCGAQFYVPIYDDVKWEDLSNLLNEIHKQKNTNSVEGEKITYKFPELKVFVAECKARNAELNGFNGLTVQEYDEMKPFAHKNGRNLLIVGGEASGISENAYNFVQNFSSETQLLNIKLNDNIDSLNTASALTLILFEMRKHLTKSSKNSQ